MAKYDPENPTPIFEVRFFNGESLLDVKNARNQRHAAWLGKVGFRLLKLHKYEDPYWTLHLRKPSYGEQIVFG